jgi:hypothetical protein
MTNDGMTKAGAGTPRANERELVRRRAELAELRTILEKTPDDPLAKPLLASRARGMEAELAKSQE